MHAGIGPGDIDWPRALVGLVIFLAPGFAWTWALRHSVGWLRSIPAAVVLGFTLEPFLMLALNLVFGVRVTLASGVYLAVAVSLGGVAFGLTGRPLRRAA